MALQKGVQKMLRCSGCGRENADSVERCVACGTGLTAKDFARGVNPGSAQRRPQAPATLATSSQRSNESTTSPRKTQTRGVSYDEVGRGYPALQTISSIFRVLGWLTIAFGVLVTILSAGAAGSADDGGAGIAIVVFVVGVLISAVYGVILLAVADLIMVFIDIERNTRASTTHR